MNTLNYQGVKDNMPCRSDYMMPNAREREAKKVAQLLLYVYQGLHLDSLITNELTNNSMSCYGSVRLLDTYTKELCKLCRAIEFDSDACHIIYNGRSKSARRLADWWDNHKDFDKKEGR